LPPAAGKAGLRQQTAKRFPLAAKLPLLPLLPRAHPCLIIGSACAGAAALVLGTSIVVPHGGIFLLPIKGAILNYSGYFAALVGGTIISALCLCLICRPLPERPA